MDLGASVSKVFSIAALDWAIHGMKNEVIKPGKTQIHTESQNGMANATVSTPTPAGGTSIAARGLSIRVALFLAVLGIVAAVVVTMVLLRNDYGVGIQALLAAIALASFGLAAYGLIESVLAIIDTAGERRRQDRDVTERRTGDRARQPRP